MEWRFDRTHEPDWARVSPNEPAIGCSWPSLRYGQYVQPNCRRGDRVRPNPSEYPLLLTTDEVARLLRTTRKAVYDMVERGLLPGVTRLGRRVLVRSDYLLDWLRQKSAPSPKE